MRQRASLARLRAGNNPKGGSMPDGPGRPLKRTFKLKEPEAEGEGPWELDVVGEPAADGPAAYPGAQPWWPDSGKRSISVGDAEEEIRQSEEEAAAAEARAREKPSPPGPSAALPVVNIVNGAAAAPEAVPEAADEEAPTPQGEPGASPHGASQVGEAGAARVGGAPHGTHDICIDDYRGLAGLRFCRLCGAWSAAAGDSRRN